MRNEKVERDVMNTLLKKEMIRLYWDVHFGKMSSLKGAGGSILFYINVEFRYK